MAMLEAKLEAKADAKEEYASHNNEVSEEASDILIQNPNLKKIIQGILGSNFSAYETTYKSHFEFSKKLYPERSVQKSTLEAMKYAFGRYVDKECLYKFYSNNFDDNEDTIESVIKTTPQLLGWIFRHDLLRDLTSFINLLKMGSNIKDKALRARFKKAVFNFIKDELHYLISGKDDFKILVHKGLFDEIQEAFEPYATNKPHHFFTSPSLFKVMSDVIKTEADYLDVVTSVDTSKDESQQLIYTNSICQLLNNVIFRNKDIEFSSCFYFFQVVPKSQISLHLQSIKGQHLHKDFIYNSIQNIKISILLDGLTSSKFIDAFEFLEIKNYDTPNFFSFVDYLSIDHYGADSPIIKKLDDNAKQYLIDLCLAHIEQNAEEFSKYNIYAIKNIFDCFPILLMDYDERLRKSLTLLFLNSIKTFNDLMFLFKSPLSSSFDKKELKNKVIELQSNQSDFDKSIQAYNPNELKCLLDKLSDKFLIDAIQRDRFWEPFYSPLQMNILYDCMPKNALHDRIVCGQLRRFIGEKVFAQLLIVSREIERYVNTIIISDKEPSIINAVIILHSDLSNKIFEWQNNQHSTIQMLIESVQAAIDKAKPTLSQHRGSKDKLAYFTLAVITAGIGLLIGLVIRAIIEHIKAAPVVNENNKPVFQFFPPLTDTKRMSMVKKLENQMAPFKALA